MLTKRGGFAHAQEDQVLVRRARAQPVDVGRRPRGGGRMRSLKGRRYGVYVKLSNGTIMPFVSDVRSASRARRIASRVNVSETAARWGWRAFVVDRRGEGACPGETKRST